MKFKKNGEGESKKIFIITVIVEKEMTLCHLLILYSKFLKIKDL